MVQAIDPEYDAIPEIMDAFRDLAQIHGDLLKEFCSAFDYRSGISGLCESEGGVSGLTGALAGLLRIAPGDFSLSATAAHCDETFEKQFKLALEQVKKDYPMTITRLRMHQQEANRPLAEILGGLFKIYVDNKDTVPY